ncbi:MAG: glycosyltransferase [Oligoflexia bacterium]|nr:glycosyltransferase [Oligoflexia bacterium]
MKQGIADQSAEKATRAVEGQTVGFISPWNQQCGLATHAIQLTQEYQPGTFVILAEETTRVSTGSDEAFVDRCWRRKSSDFSQLEAAIERHRVGLLHVNCHYLFFPQPEFSQFIARQRAKGIKCVINLHTVWQIDANIQALVTQADKVVVHSPEVRLEAIANGADPEKVVVLNVGVRIRPPLDERAKQNLRLKLQLPVAEKIIVAFGFIQPHKGMEGVIEAVARLRDIGIAARGYICGQPHDDDPYGKEYVAELQRMAQSFGVADRINVLNRYLDDDEVGGYLSVADVVLMNYRSQHYEGSGACSMALGAGAVVAASIAPPFAAFGDAVWHITSGYNVASSVEALLTNMNLRRTIQANAKRYCENNSWKKLAEHLDNLYQSLGFSTSTLKKESTVESSTAKSNPRVSMRILMQMRPNAFSQRGGDTVVMDKLANGLRARGVDVTVDPEGKQDPSQFDIVHLFNFALADHTKSLAMRARQAGTPYVVTTLYEDTPAYRNQAITQAIQLCEYINRRQDKNWWEAHATDCMRVAPAQRFENAWTAEHAAALFPNGAQETKALKRDYPRAGRMIEVKLGHEVGAQGDAAEFEQAYGVRDFVLCVGRFEFRKNQLMLLKALEDSEVTVVLASGGFSYDADYDRAVRSFKRKGKTLILDRLSPQMLASAYAAAKVHALPSWYELPGLVSLEAAHHGCNVVVGNNGTAPDYFGSHAFYCDPWNESSIRNAVLAAYHAPVSAELKALAKSYTWERCVAETLGAYEQILGSSSVYREVEVKEPITAQKDTMSTSTEPKGDFATLLEQGENAAIEERWDESASLLDQALQMNPQSARANKARGTLYLAQSRNAEARPYFERAHALDPLDPRAMSGLGMCELRAGRMRDAYSYFLQALERDARHLPTLLQFMECSYATNTYTDLERILRKYISERPDDSEMQFCLAGVCYKLGRSGEADELCRKILVAKPNHKGALELRNMMEKQNTTTTENKAPQATGSTAVRAGFIGQAPTASPAVSTPATFGHVDAELLKLEELKREGKFDEVRSGLNSLGALQLNASQRERMLTLDAELCVLNQDIVQAAEKYEEVMRVNPQSPRGMCGKGALAAHAGKWDEARRFFETALQLKPEYDVALAGMGLCCSWFKEHERAWDFYTRAIRINPENARALLGVIELGYPMQRLTDVEQGVRAYLDMHPLDFQFLYALAGCLYAQGKLDEASEELKKIALFEPTNSRVRELQQMIDEHKGQPAQASAAVAGSR